MTGLTDRQREIVQAAIHIISRKGIQELTIRNLARDLGITEPAIYRHFRSKSDILATMLEYLHRDTIAIFDQVQRGESALARLRDYFTRLFERLRDNPATAAVVFSDEAFMNDDRLAATVRALVELTIDNTTNLLTLAQENGEIRADVDEYDLSTMLAGGVRLLVRRWHMSGNNWDLVAQGRSVIETFVKLVEVPR